MKASLITGLTFMVVAMCTPAAWPQAYPFDGCGLAMGESTITPGCNLFRADNGLLYRVIGPSVYMPYGRAHIQGHTLEICAPECGEDDCLVVEQMFPCRPDFRNCGVLVQMTPSCLVFMTLDGRPYVLENLRSFGPGDPVYVEGVFQDCDNPCGDCIRNNSIIAGCPGDLNCDRVVNNFDIDAFVQALTNPAGYHDQYPDCNINDADINGDGAVNNFDIDWFVAVLINP